MLLVVFRFFFFFCSLQSEDAMEVDLPVVSMLNEPNELRADMSAILKPLQFSKFFTFLNPSPEKLLETFKDIGDADVGFITSLPMDMNSQKFEQIHRVFNLIEECVPGKRDFFLLFVFSVSLLAHRNKMAFVQQQNNHRWEGVGIHGRPPPSHHPQGRTKIHSIPVKHMMFVFF